MKEIIKNNNVFFIPYLLFLLLGGFILLIFTKEETHLYVNSFHSNFFDSFFKIYTWLGDGWLAVFMTVILSFVRYRYALVVGLSYTISSIVAQLLKHTLFSEALRPTKFFENLNDLYLVPGVDTHLFNSFPSGHATTAFSLYLALALIVRSKGAKVLLFAIAIMVAYSRVYLSQHFFVDVYVGSLIGVITTLFVYNVLNKLEKINSINWLNYSILKRKM